MGSGCSSPRVIAKKSTLSHFTRKSCVESTPIHSFLKNCEKPDKSEGFSEVKTARFVAGFLIIKKMKNLLVT